MSSKLQLGMVVLFVLMLSAVGCHRLECESDEDCPAHWTCVGSSLCPDDVECVWEGEPGLCLPIDEEHICSHTGGEWDEGSCGHYECGEFPACDAVIPGCNCGPDANFVEGRGCVEDIACTGGCYGDEDCDDGLVCHGSRIHPKLPTEREMHMPSGWCVWGHERPGVCVEPELALCENSGGRWDETSCGDYDCGRPPVCTAVIPGCDCGPKANYVEGEGCVEDPGCPGVCESHDDCEEGEICQRPRLHVEPGPDGLANLLGSFEEVAGLGMCIDADIPLCRKTGGTWDETRCGHSSCGSPITCLAIIPGCDCGPWASWVEGEGCVRDPECAPTKCNDEHPCPDGFACERRELEPTSIDPDGISERSASVIVRRTDYGICKPI